MFNPPITGNKELDAYLYDLSLNLDGSAGTTESNPNIPGGDPGSYTYQYIQIKYATDNVGTGFSNTPTNKTYFGIYNSSSSTESNNPADYTWYLSGFPFGTTYFLYYLILGGRKIKFAVNTSPPDYHWKQDDGTAVDLDILVPPATVSFNEIMNAAVTELKIASNAVTATKLNVAALDQAFGDLRPNTVSAAQIATGAVSELKLLDGAVTAAKTAVAAISPITGNLTANSVGTTQITDNAITSQKITANAITAGKIAADAIVASNIQAGTITGDRILANTITGNNIAALTIGAQAIASQAITSVKIESGAITSDKIFAGAVTSDKITVNDLSAINANMGTITAGTLTAGTIFGGALNAATGTFSGSLSAATGTFAGSMTVGSSPNISGTTMTGAGARINSNGTFALGNSSTNVTYNGSTMYLNGNVVTTENINLNAVTVPVSAFTANTFTNTQTNTWQVAQSVSITTSGSRVYISAAGQAFSTVLGEDNASPSFRLTRDGTQLMTSGAEPALSFSETPSAGTYTYALEIQTPFNGTIAGGASISNRSIFVIETKR
jgi:hypothetical protein